MDSVDSLDPVCGFALSLNLDMEREQQQMHRPQHRVIDSFVLSAAAARPATAGRRLTNERMGQVGKYGLVGGSASDG